MDRVKGKDCADHRRGHRRRSRLHEAVRRRRREGRRRQPHAGQSRRDAGAGEGGRRRGHGRGRRSRHRRRAREKAVDATLKAYGRIDILVNCAGVGYSWLEKSPGSMGAVDDTTPEKWARGDGDQPRLRSSTCAGSSIPQMKKQGGGAIVNVTSISGLQGLPVAHTYTAAKGAAINLTRSHRHHLLRRQHPRQLHRAGLHRDADGGVGARPVRRSGDGRPPHADEASRHRRKKWPMAASISAPTKSTYCQGTVLVIDGGTTARQ